MDIDDIEGAFWLYWGFIKCDQHEDNETGLLFRQWKTGRHCSQYLGRPLKGITQRINFSYPSITAVKQRVKQSCIFPGIGERAAAKRSQTPIDRDVSGSDRMGSHPRTNWCQIQCLCERKPIPVKRLITHNAKSFGMHKVHTKDDCYSIHDAFPCRFCGW